MLSERKNNLSSMLHLLGLCSAFLSVLFVVNNFLIFGFDAPGVVNVLGLNKIFGVESLKGGYSSGLYIVGLFQTAAVFGVIFWACFHTIKRGQLRLDAERLDWLSAYVIRAAFGAVLSVGIADAIMSFMRVEDFHKTVFGDSGGAIIALPSSRGIYIHVPLIIVAALIALRDKSVSLVKKEAN